MRAFLQQLQPIWNPHQGQLEFLESKSKFKVLACGRRWGKSDACAVEVLYRLLQDAPTKHLIIAPTSQQATIIFDRVIELLHSWKELFDAPPFKVRMTPHPRLEIGHHRLIARSGKVGYFLRGNEATHITVDEAAFVPESTITDIAMPMLATNDGYLTLISTPNGMNHFWKFFELGRAGEHGVWSKQCPTKENPLVSESFLETQRALFQDRAYQIEYEARFADSTGRVFRTEKLEKCLVPLINAVENGPVTIGIDWARYSDFTAIVVLAGSRDDCQVIEIQRWNGLDWTTSVTQAAELINRYPKARVLCDATGVGDPVIEMLRRKSPSRAADGLVFTATEKLMLIEQLAWLIESEKLKMQPHTELMKELSHFEASTGRSGRIRHEAANGYHDDLVIALALASKILPEDYRPSIHLTDSRTFRRQTRRSNPC